MSEKILAGLNEYHSLMLAISAISCIAILYFYMKKNKINLWDTVSNTVSTTVSTVSTAVSKLKLNSKTSKKSKKPRKNLSWGVVNSHNIRANSREPIYQIYSVY